MDELFIEAFSTPGECGDGCILVPLESLVTIFILQYCKDPAVQIFFVVKHQSNEVKFKVKTSNLRYEIVKEDNVPVLIKSCQLPAVNLANGNTCVAGLCAILRQVIKSTSTLSLNHHSQTLLGFRQGCLMACAESSMWTKFCEVDMIQTVKTLLFSPVNVGLNDILMPEDVIRFERHMEQPLRIHNILKQKQDFAKSKGVFRRKKMSTEDDDKIDGMANNTEHCGREIVLEHCFAEGPTLTLADVILFPCLYIALKCLSSVYLQNYVPLTLKWLERVKEKDEIKEAMSVICDIPHLIGDTLYVKYLIPSVPNQSLYKSDPRRYKPRNRIFTRQQDVENSLRCVEHLRGAVEWDCQPFGYEVEFDWEAIPYEAHPKAGNLPATRLERKGQQLENLAKAVLKVAVPGDTIVDFCSGSGHLGIILAHFLPRCKVILLENKEESLSRARERVKKLSLPNVAFYQCNLDYYKGSFNIGVSLHACGVATDLVIQRCIEQRAVFICCPCCYGTVQNNHIVTYPRSQLFKDSSMTLREYLVIGHSADQTHDENNVKTDQGKKCMGIIDMDRCLQAKEASYEVYMAKLIPESCTPKNNLLVGIPSEKYDSQVKKV